MASVKGRGFGDSRLNKILTHYYSNMSREYSYNCTQIKSYRWLAKPIINLEIRMTSIDTTNHYGAQRRPLR